MIRSKGTSNRSEHSQDEGRARAIGETTFIIVTRGQLIACSIDYFVRHWMRAGNAMRIETEARLHRVLHQIATGSGPDGELLFIVDATAFSPSGNALVASLCTRKETASALYFGADVDCPIPRSKRISVFPDLSYASSRIKWERHLRRFVKFNSQASDPVAGRAASDARALKALEHHEVFDVPRLALTPRQSEVLGLVLRGMTNKQIALRVGLAESTVKAYVGELMAHFKVYRRTHLMALSMGGPR